MVCFSKPRRPRVVDSPDSGNKALENPESSVHSLLSGLQEKIAILPGYDFRKQKDEQSTDSEGKNAKADAWPLVSAGTSVSGLLGGAMSLALAGLIGFGIKIFQKRKPK